MQEKINIKHIGDISASDGTLNQKETCAVQNDDNTTYYNIMLPAGICAWMRNQSHNGLAFGFAMALVLRMKWDEILRLKFEHLLICSEDGIYIPRIECINGVDHYYGRMIRGGRLFTTWLLARVSHLHSMGYDIEDIYNLPAVSKKDDPVTPATAENLEKYTRDMLDMFYSKTDIDKHGLSPKEGAVI